MRDDRRLDLAGGQAPDGGTVRSAALWQRRQREAARLRDFAADGEPGILERIGDNLAELVAIATQLREVGLLPAKHGIGIDPGNSHAVVDALTAAGSSRSRWRRCRRAGGSAARSSWRNAGWRRARDGMPGRR
ncbi:MAG TPA: hypothetical protein VGN83_27810 [Falsiroseomonas sp.]|nr:hypothetical protein [Falsiroseomonas sp.]